MVLSLFLRFRNFWRKLSVKWKVGFLTLFLIVGALSIPGFVRETASSQIHQAELYFLDAPTVAIGQDFPVELRIKTNGTNINAMGFTIIYNPLYLQVTSMTTDNSFCTFYLDNSYDNQKGQVKLSCGAPNPGFRGDSLAVHLTMRGSIAGNPSVIVDPTTTLLLANDAKGSNIVKSSPKLSLNIQQL